MSNILIIVCILFLIFNPLIAQQCTSSQYERCLCITSNPYCTCSAITSTNSLNFSSSYNSHLVSVPSQGCRPCSSNCQRCSSLTICTQCLPSFELVSGSCIACPANCQTCSNGVCSTCIGGYYIDYQTNCQVCPIIGTSICTINSLQSCLSNYWLDNNAANCISCDPNCLQCSSTTKCSLCNQGYYLLSNYTCAPCQSQCFSCTDSKSCTICTNQTLYFDGTTGTCLIGSVDNCSIYSSSSKCSQCMPGFYLNTSGLCVQVDPPGLISECQVYGILNNKTIVCRNCTTGYFNLTSGCFYGCSVLCTSCYGPHYGLCYGCISSAYLMNFHCIPTFNLNEGASYQLFYTAFNNPTFFSGKLINSNGCILQSISGASSGGQVSISLSNLQSYEVTLIWKAYLYNLPNNISSISYSVIFNNSINQIATSFNATYCLNHCNDSSVCIHKGSLNIASIILNSNQVIFSLANAQIGLSQVLIVAERCGGIQGNACLQCSSTSTCTKCVNPKYYISGHTCVISCPADYYVRTATQTCLSQCLSGTYSDNIKLICQECKSPCLTCSSQVTCLTCVNNTYLYGQNCLSSCPLQYYPSEMRRTCDSCVRPCLTCLSNLQCLSCMYGFYYNLTHSCVLKCDLGYYGSLQTLNCQKCIQPCLTCNSNAGTTCLSCIDGTYYYSFTCLTNCPLGYFEQGSQCVVCDSQCKSCSRISSNCTSCPLESYLYDFKCISNCPQKYFADRIDQTCNSCPKNCLQCISSSLCQKCYSGFVYHSSSYSCLSLCPQFYYSNDQICYSCQAPCLSCISATRCLNCKGLFLFNQTCFSVCPSGTYGDTSAMECLACNISLCNECFESPDRCTSCNASLILFDHNCLEKCPNGYYIQNTNYACLACKDSCIICKNLTYCMVCEDTYIIQDGNCIKQCDVGRYYDIVNHLKICLVCPQGCTSCSLSNTTTVTCNACKVNYYNNGSICLNLCQPQFFGSNGQCFRCINPCFTCLSETLCLSCEDNMGYLFNNSCLNACPLGYYQNNTSNSCEKCTQTCLNCLSPTQCLSCKNGWVLQSNTCISSCLLGYYSLSSLNACSICDQLCQICNGLATNCSVCFQNSSILFNGNCITNCLSGYYKYNSTCLTCPQNCLACSNQSYCIQCSLSYYLFSNNKCLSACPAQYFSLNGFCRQCSYPCKTCLNFQICLSCQYGYVSSGACVAICNPPSYLDSSSQSCTLCPSNCSNCLSPTNCLECLEGVLVNGTCLSQCPQGYYDYYSICAPCMYGCLTCSDSSTCTFCFIGYLFKGVCLQFCPVGWVNNNQSTFCQQCIQGCLKCTVQANQCTLCGNGLFLYLYSCLTTCPLGTFKDYKQNNCDTCKSPCQTCENGFSCITCIYGYLLYSQQSGNQCIEGPKCPNSFYLNKINNTCVYQCPLQTYVDPIGYTCNKPCSLTYVLLKDNSTCLQSCPSGMWINSNFVCESSNPPIQLPTVSCQGLVLRNILIVECSFNMPIANLQTLAIDKIKITDAQVLEIIIIDSRKIRIVTDVPVNVFRQTYFTVSIVDRYQLYSNIQADAVQTLQEKQRRLTQNYKMPVQNTKSIFYLKQYFSYSNQQRDTGMQLMQIAQSICIGSFIFWVFSLLKNMKSTSLTFICLLQWTYSLSLIDTAFAPNLGLFLEGFKVSNLFVSSYPEVHYIWIIKSSYRETLWGLLNLFNFSTVFLPSIIVASFFGLVFLLTLNISKRYCKDPLQQQAKQSQRQGVHESKQIKKQANDKPQGYQQSIFSNERESFEKQQSIVTKNIFQRNNSNIPTIRARSSKKSRFSFESQANLQIQRSQTSSKKVQEQQKQQQKKEDKEDKEGEQKKQQSWQSTKYKIGLKCKIIHTRFYYNYWLHCILLTASPLSIAVCCQIISANISTLIASIFFAIFSFFVMGTFLRKLSQEKLFISTKYWFILYIETIIQNGLAILSTAQIYIGVMMLMLIINIYVWNKMFSSKKANQLKHFYQINDGIRILLLLEAFVGYTKKNTWDSDTYYYYSWVFIVTLIVLIVFAAIQNTKQFFEREEGVKKSQTRIKSQVQSSKSDTQGSTLKSRFALNQKGEEQQEQQIESKSKVDFFSQHEYEQGTDSDNDIIDFDQASEEMQRKAPKELIRYQKMRRQ